MGFRLDNWNNWRSSLVPSPHDWAVKSVRIAGPRLSSLRAQGCARPLPMPLTLTVTRREEPVGTISWWSRSSSPFEAIHRQKRLQKQLSGHLVEADRGDEQQGRTAGLFSVQPCSSLLVPLPSGGVVARPSLAASQRLDQLSSHLNPSRVDQPPSTGAGDPPSTLPGRPRRKPRSQIEALPPDSSDALSHVKTLESIASAPDPTNRGDIRQKTAGKL